MRVSKKVVCIIYEMPLVNDLPINVQGAKMVLFTDDTNIQIKVTNEDILNKKIRNYAAAANLVSCKWASDKFWENYSNVI